MSCGAFILGCSAPHLTQAERAFFRAADPWGFILFARNVEDPRQLRRLTSDLRETVGRDAPVLIDQEGGRVARLRRPFWREWPAPLDQVLASGDAAADVMRARYRIIAHELREVGIDTNCAPCADIANPATHPILRNRCYGEDVETVTRLARAVAEGLLAGGVLPVLKHIPGHGRATVDSHKALPTVDASAEVLAREDFAPFRALNDLPLGMSAHVVYAGLGETGPATTSPAMIARIRGEIGFDGLLMSDDLSMNALAGTIAERARDGIAAGLDVILHCNGEMEEMQQVVDAAGRLPQAAQRRAVKALEMRSVPDPVDIAAIEADLQTAMQGQGHV